MSLPGELTNANLGDVSFILHRDWGWEAVSYNIEAEVTAELDEAREQARADLTAQVKWHSGDANEPLEGPFELRVTVVGRFRWSEPDWTDEEIKGWLEFNSQHLLWPYLRSYISQITTSSGLPPLTIYTITAPNSTLGAVDESVPAPELPLGSEG